MKTLKHIIFALILIFHGLSLVAHDRFAAHDRFKVKVIHKTDEYTTGVNHTLLVDLQNTSDEIDSLKTDLTLPQGWTLITSGTIGQLKAGEKKLVLISFYIPANASPGSSPASFHITDQNDRILQTNTINFTVAESHKLEVNKVESPQFVQAGETINSRFEIKNNGNVTEEIKLSSRNTIEGEQLYTLAPDSTIIVKISQETDSKNYFINSVNSNLEVQSTTSNEVLKAFSVTNVFPVKIEQKDPYLRFPVQFSTFYNSYTSKQEHFYSMSYELKGNGFLDAGKAHHLNFIFRGPNQNDIRRFGMNDQYSLIYKYKDQTSLYLGDHSYYVNRLGFSGRYGMGFRLDQQINNWTLSAFFTKPRLYSYYSTPLFGAKAVYQVSDSLSIGASVVRSKGNNQSYNQHINANPDEIGQIIVTELDYTSKNTRIQAESSISITNEHVDYAAYLNFSQRFGKFRYSGNTTIAGKNYFGTLNNSFRFGNTLIYSFNKWDFAVGQGFSKLNQRLDPLLYSAEPSFQNYYSSIRYRFNKNNAANVRVDQRIREDQQTGEKNYHYKEHGFDYRYRYSNSWMTVGFNGRIAKTRNLLSLNSDSRTTYGHYLTSNIRISPKLTLRSNISHNYTNRYGNSNQNSNYYRYGAGFNYRFNQNYRINLNYNSGYSPEENYQKRDFVNAGVVARFNKNHSLEARTNYYANPGVANKKELYAYVKYTYSFGAPVKKVLKQGGVYGRISSDDPTIDLKGIQIIAAGNSVRSDSKGNFELNNLPLGTNLIIIDQASLPANIVTSVKMPFKVEIEENQKVPAQIKLVKAGNIQGKLTVDREENDNSDYNLEGYLKLQNDEFTYYIESDKDGNFKFQHLVPGNYNLSMIKLKNEKKLNTNKKTSVSISGGDLIQVVLDLKVKGRKIKFMNNNFKVGQ